MVNGAYLCKAGVAVSELQSGALAGALPVPLEAGLDLCSAEKQRVLSHKI